jgi:hypothetical protein
MNTPVNIFVLSNDMQDDDLLTDIGIAVDQDMNQQIGAAEIDFLTFPEQATYTPPDGFVGTATFTYDIMGLGSQFDYTSTDTATVTVTVTDVPPPVVAVDDMKTILPGEPVTIDVLENDMQAAGVIAEFTPDALDDMGNLQPGTVTLLENGTDQLVYTPPAGFAGTVTFTYTIIGEGPPFELDSEDTAVVTVHVVAPLGAIVQFEDASLEVFEILFFFVGQDSIDQNIPDALLFGPGEISGCFEVSSGTDVALQARLLIDDVTVIDGICPELEPGMEYTISVQPNPLQIVCVPGLAAPVLCN